MRKSAGHLLFDKQAQSILPAKLDCSKDVELPIQVYDHVEHKYQKGFTMRNHDIYKRGENEFETIERHKEIPERLAQAILKRRGLK